MINVYVIIRKSSGELAHSRALYTSAGTAKSALRQQFGKWSHNYAVARIGSEPTVIASANEDGSWAVSE